MAANGKHEQLRLGFLTAIEVPDKGFVGGLLVTNHYGRPLEFQCTAPVRPNASQQILYGPTLAPFVLGELIGGTLIDEAGVKPDLILTDREPILELRNRVDAPVALVDASPPAGDEAAEATTKAVRLGRQVLRFHAAHLDDREIVARETPRVPADADLLEPFERVREALRETVKNGTMR
jgi:hypothetical protein